MNFFKLNNFQSRGQSNELQVANDLKGPKDKNGTKPGSKGPKEPKAPKNKTDEKGVTQDSFTDDSTRNVHKAIHFDRKKNRTQSDTN